MTLTHPTTRNTPTGYGAFCCRQKLCSRSFARDLSASRARSTFFGAASICVAHALADAALLPERASSRRKRSEEHTSELQSHLNLVCRLLLEKKKTNSMTRT